MTGLERVTYLDEDKLRTAFLFQETRKTDKAGVLSLFGTKYQAPAGFGKKRVQVRFDPEQLDEIEIWYQDALVERVRPFEVRVHRRPKAAVTRKPASPSVGPKKAGWLDHLVKKRRDQGFHEPTPEQLAAKAREDREQAIVAILATLREHLAEAIVDEAIVRDFLGRFGPFEPTAFADVLLRVLRQQPADQHVQLTLEAVRALLTGGAS
ncbi:MAG: Mu transposase C-terminal domain-containing protein [Myxococcota bacterium]